MSYSPQSDPSWAPLTLLRAQTRTVTASANGHDYRLSVSLPTGTPPASGFPMLVVLDGTALFPTVAETERRLSHRSAVTGVVPMVVVGVGAAGTDLYDTAQRHRDFTPGPPAHAEDAGQWSTGGAEAFLAFLLEQVVPLASQTAPVDPARVSLMGHSLAGYFALDVLTRRPDAFAGYSAVSPSIWWDADRVMEAARSLAPSAARVSLAVGRREQDDDAGSVRNRRRMVDALEAFGAALAPAIAPDRLDLSVFADEDHASVVSPAAVRALRMASAASPN